MSVEGVKKVTMSVPTDLVAELDFVCERLGLSRSALVSALLTPIVPSYVEVCGRRSIYGDVARRFRSGSRTSIIEALHELLDELKDEQYDLFKD